MKNWLYNYKCAIFCLVLTFPCLGQNLVTNGSFEIISSCPYDENQLSLAIGWINPNYGSPDLFASCSDFPVIGIPVNAAGIQKPLSGTNYAHFLVSNFNGGRYYEYISTALAETLKKDIVYEVVYRISLGNYSTHGLDRMGVLFSSNQPFYATLSRIEELPQLESKKRFVLADTANWIEIRDTFVATGTEKYMTIGQFYPNDSLSFIYLPNPILTFASYYIDGVEVNEIKKPEKISRGFEILPNPTSGFVTVRFTSFVYTIVRLQISDASGKVVYSQTIQANQEIPITLPVLANGLYFCSIVANKQIIANEKLVVQQ